MTHAIWASVERELDRWGVERANVGVSERDLPTYAARATQILRDNDPHGELRDWSIVLFAPAPWSDPWEYLLATRMLIFVAQDPNGIGHEIPDLAAGCPSLFTARYAFGDATFGCSLPPGHDGRHEAWPEGGGRPDLLESWTEEEADEAR